MYAIVAGGGRVGYYLSKTLAQDGHEVILVEKRAAACHQLSLTLGDVVLHGDASEARILELAGAGRADVIAAVTGEDDDNLVICQMAKQKFGVKRTIARVNNPDNEQLFSKLGIDQTVSSTRIIYNLIEQEMESGAIVPLSTLRRGNLELVEVTVTALSPATGRSLQELPLPQDCLIIALLRGETVMIPQGATVVEAHDVLVAVVDARREREFRDIVAPGRS